MVLTGEGAGKEAWLGFEGDRGVTDLTEFWKLEFEYQSAEVVQRMEIQNQIGQGALKSMMLTNGGAIIGLLTFIGNKGTVTDSQAVQWGLALFGMGLFTGLLAYFGAYFSQADFMQDAGYRVANAQSRLINGDPVEAPKIHESRGTYLLYAAVALLFLSLLAFGGGAITTLNGIL